VGGVMSNKQYYVYILSNWNNEVLYIGVTNNLKRRVYEHKNNTVRGFTEKYNVDKLVYYEIYNDAYTAIGREKQLKGLMRYKKEHIIENINPLWKDLYDSI